MKNFFACLLTLSMAFLLSIPAFATDFSGNAEFELESVSNKIVTAINEVYGDKSVTVTAADVDFGKAYKVYVDTDVFELTTNSAAEIEAVLENGNYVYVLPVNTANGTVVVNLQKGLPLSDNAKAVLTEDEQQEVIDNVGKWTVSSLAFYNSGNSNYNYEARLSNIIGEIPEGTLLVGSLPIFQDVVALIPNDAGMIDSLIPVTDTEYDSNLIGPTTRGGSEIFSYERVKDIANNLPEADPELAGGTVVDNIEARHPMFLFYGVIIALVVIVCSISFFFARKKTTAK